MVTYKSLMATGHAPRRRQLASVSPRPSGHPGILGETKSDSSPCSSSIRDIGTGIECMTCLSCSSKITKNRKVADTSVNKGPNRIPENDLFSRIISGIIVILVFLYSMSYLHDEMIIKNQERAEKLAPFFLDEFRYLQDMAKQGNIVKENYFGTKENVPRIPFSRRQIVDVESVRAIHAVIKVYEGVGHSNIGKDWRAHLVEIGKSIRGPIDSVVAIEDEGSEQLLSCVRMLLDVCLIDETLEVLDHEMLIGLSVYKVENPLESPWTAQIQEYIDRVKEFDAMYCRPAPPQ